MHNLNCYLFEDGFKAYFSDDRKNHILAAPGETITFAGQFSRAKFKNLKVPYAQWARRWAQ